MPRNYTSYSRFTKTPVFITNGVETYGKWIQYRFLTARPTDNQIGVFRVSNQFEGKPDLIANSIYGTPMLDWVLIAFNNASDVFNWPRAGDTIEYPIESIVMPEILQQNVR